MFYRTQIKSVTDFGVVDMAGKKLRFMGYLPVKAGDWVFTDGTYVFGNVPPRGSPATFGDDPAGVPVLDSGTLRGYFSRNGNFKNYPVKQDSWLVNSDKKFAHGSEDNVIDAELADDGSLLTVEKNKQQLLEIDESTDCIFKYSAYQHDMYSMHEEFKGGDILLPDISASDADCFRYDDDLFKDCELIIKKDTKVMETFYLSELCATCEEDALSFVTVIGGFVSRESLEVSIGDHIKSRAILKNFKIFPDGKWQALILCEVWAERGVSYETHSQRVVHYSGTYDVRETRIDGTTTFNEVITTISITQHPEPILSTEFASTLAKCLYLVNVNSDGETILIRKSYIAYPLYLRQQKIEVTSAFTPSTNLTSPNDFPYIRVEDSTSILWIGNLTYWATGAGFSPEWYNGQLRYCSYHSYYFHWGEYDHHYTYTYFSNVCNSKTIFIYDSSVIPQLPFIYNSEQSVRGEPLTFPVQDNFRANFINAEEDIDKWTLDGIFDANNKEVFGAFLPDETDAHTWNMGCASLNGGSYLFGIHDKALYKIDRDGNPELVGDNLKNFRLRELKKISKSRR